MKYFNILSKFILTSVFLLSSWFSYSQTYEPVLKLDRTWGIEVTQGVFAGGIDIEYYDMRLSLIDTVHIDSFVYYIPDVWITMDSMLFREDSIEKRVYGYNVTQQEEYILLDFSLEVGDTLPNNFRCLNRIGYYEEVIGAIVTSVNYEEINDGSERKSFFIQSNSTDCYFMNMIEGLGGATGYYSSGMSYFEHSRRLKCVKDEGNDGFVYGFCEPLSIDEEEHHDIKVYPNPFTNHLQMNSSVPTFMYVYNVLGEEIYRSSSLLRSHTLSTESYPSGIYMIKWIDVDGSITFLEKVIKE